MDNMFEQASRLKLRFETTVGSLSVEDLWDLPLTATNNRVSLDTIAVGIHRLLRDTGDTVSFVEPAAEDTGKALTSLKFDLVKRIIEVRVAERNEQRDAAVRHEKKQRILELIAAKEDEALGGKSVEELRALAESL